MAKKESNSSRTDELNVAQRGQAAGRLRRGADGSVVVLEEGEPCLESSADGAQWDWDTEAVSSAVRCQECGNAEKVFREPDGRILCEICLLRAPAETLPASE